MPYGLRSTDPVFPGQSPSIALDGQLHNSIKKLGSDTSDLLPSTFCL
jgi:hypothetical protein